MDNIEILAPAGDIKSLYAAFEAGTDAVYFGVSEFNARKRAENINISDLAEIVSEAYLRNIKLYLTLNTLLTSGEIPSVLDLIDSVMGAGIRCFIVQDYGILNILEKFYPEAEIHVSTQATTHLKGQLDFLSDTEAARVNLARELSASEIRDFTCYAHEKGIETEVFVHGSFCLSYSGQCYLSSFLEGLSGNRGLCAQLCRRLYTKNGKKGYFLNLKDNCALPYAAKIIESGADSLKIEGRIKGSDYVYTAVKAWNDIVSSMKSRPSGSSAAEYIDDAVYERQSRALSSVFNRGFTSGYTGGRISGMFSDTPSDASYKNVAEVISYSADRNILEIRNPVEISCLQEGDSAYPFDSGKADMPGVCGLKDQSGKISFPLRIILKQNIKGSDERYICSGYLTGEISPCRYIFKIEGKLNGKIGKGNLVYAREINTVPDSVLKKLENPVFRKIPVSASLKCRVGERLELLLESDNRKITAYSDIILEKGEKRISTEEEVEKQLSRFGNTALSLSSVSFSEFDDGIFIPSSTVNRVRRKAVSMFLDTIDEKRKDTVLKYFDDNEKVKSSGSGNSIIPGVKNKTAVITDVPELAEYLKQSSADEVFYEFSSLYNERKSGMEEGRLLNESCIIPVFPGIMTEEYAEKCIETFGKNKFRKTVINNTAMIKTAEEKGIEWIAGDSLNILNHSAVDFFGRFRKFTGFIISPEAGMRDIKSLSEKISYEIYIPLYTRARLMTTRQCLLGMRCGKSRCDDKCFTGNCGTEELTDVKGKKILVEKRVNSYTELYDSRYHFIPDAVSDFADTGASFIIDLRIFPDLLNFYSRDRKREIDKKIELYETLKHFISNRGSKRNPEIKKLLSGTYPGNYINGLR